MWLRRSSLEAGEQRRAMSARGGGVQHSRGSCATCGRAQEAVGEEDRGTGRTVAFGRDVPVLAAAAPALVSAREGSRVMGRGLWHVAAVRGERWHAHTRNRTQSASQSASRRCQAPCPRAVTKLAWPKQRPGAAKPCLRARPCSATSRRGDGSYPGRPDATLPSWQVSG